LNIFKFNRLIKNFHHSERVIQEFVISEFELWVL